MNITEITCKTLRKDLDAALAAVGAKHGLNLVAGGMRYTDKTVRIKVDGAVIENGVAIDPDFVTLQRYMRYLGLKESDLINSFTIMGKSYKLSGYVPRRYSKPFVLIELSTGQKKVAPKDLVLNALKVMKHGADDLGSLR